jgi:hypothetical protein
MATPIVEPTAAAPAVQQTPASPAPAAPPVNDEDGGGIPNELIKIPAVQAVLAGAPPAVSMRIKGLGEREDIKSIVENKDALLGAGFAFYRSINGDLGVMFNAMRIHPEDIKAADQQGKLRQIAPDFDLVNHEVAKLGPDHPVRNATAPSGPAAQASSAPPQSASGQLPLMPPPPASVQRRLAQQRVMNLQPGAPTSGPAPGAGRLLNSVLKGVV